jgi:hypothetical protein
MKRALSAILILIAVMFLIAANCRAETVAVPDGDFIDMYKGYFRDMQANRSRQVWDALTLASKNTVAKTLNDSAIAMKNRAAQAGGPDKPDNNIPDKQYTQADILDMLNNNTSNIRDEYIIGLNEGFEQISFYKKVLEGKYSVKSSAKDRIVITISMDDDPRDFQVLREDGRWKINFFEDMML